MIKRISILITILIVAAIVFFWLRPHSKFLLTLMPPSDLYTPIVKEQIKIDEKNRSSKLQATHNYVGTYLVGVYIKAPPPFGTPIESSAVLALSIMENDRLVFKEKFTNWASRFGGPGKNESGVILGYYKVPKDIPLGGPINAIVSIDNPDPIFEKKYGKADFFIRRKSDQ
ncbi:MAG: hypothetical protein ABIJ59_10525 [Pseudomonadota bacterium]